MDHLDVSFGWCHGKWYGLADFLNSQNFLWYLSHPLAWPFCFKTFSEGSETPAVWAWGSTLKWEGLCWSHASNVERLIVDIFDTRVTKDSDNIFLTNPFATGECFFWAYEFGWKTLLGAKFRHKLWSHQPLWPDRMSRDQRYSMLVRHLKHIESRSWLTTNHCEPTWTMINGHQPLCNYSNMLQLVFDRYQPYYRWLL